MNIFSVVVILSCRHLRRVPGVAAASLGPALQTLGGEEARLGAELNTIEEENMELLSVKREDT